MASNSDSDGSSYDWTNGWRLKKKQMEEDISRKNEQLNQLMDDIQQLEEERSILRGTVATLRANLKEANEELDGLASDYSAIRDANQRMQERLLESEDQKTVLEGRLEEAIESNQQQERQFCIVNTQVEEKLDQIQKVLAAREGELKELKELRLTEQHQQLQSNGKFGTEGDVPTVTKLKHTLEAKNKDLAKLTANLRDAVKEIDESASVIAKLRQETKCNSSSKLKDQVIELRKQLHQERLHCSRLKLQLDSAEEDAQLYAKDLSAVTSDLTAYLSGDFTLSDAVKELKASRNELSQRDDQLAQLTALSNGLQIQVNDLMDENSQLRSQLQLEPKENLSTSPGASKWQDSKKIITKLNRKIKDLEEEKVNLRTELYALMRELSNMRATVQITALEVPVREALASLAEGGNSQIQQELAQVKKALAGIGAGVSALGEAGIANTVQERKDYHHTGQEKVVEELQGTVASLTQEADRHKEHVQSLEFTLEAYRQQFSSLLSEVTSISAVYRDQKDAVDERSVESGQLNITDTDLCGTAEEDSLQRVSSASREDESIMRIHKILQASQQTAAENQSKITEIIKQLRSLGNSSNIPDILIKEIEVLFHEIYQDRTTVTKLLSEAKDVQFDTRVTLRQLQAKLNHMSEMEQIYGNEQTEQNAAKWCQNFHKQRLVNIELKDKINLLREQLATEAESLSQRDRRIKQLTDHINRSFSGHNIQVSNQNVQNDRDYATIAVQTSEPLEDFSCRAPVETDSFVLGQAISDLDKERALNANLQRSLREKELHLISKDQLINKVKSEIKYYPPNSQEVPSTIENMKREEIPSDYVNNLKSKIEEDSRTIFRYQLLLEKAHKEHQKEIYDHKKQFGNVIKERDDALKDVKELQLRLDSIPAKDTDFGQQQAMFVEQIQSMSETIRVLEKQLSSCRIEKSDLESEKNEFLSELKKEQERHRRKEERQEVACKIKSNQLERENERLQEINQQQKAELEKMLSRCKKFEQEVNQSPSLLLTALVKKMRDELVQKEKLIVELQEKMEHKA